MNRPAWLLDVDGVLNGFGRCGWSAPPRTSRASAAGTQWRMRWAPQLTARIGALHASGQVDIYWATTWIDHGTEQIARIMGLPPGLPHAYRPEDALYPGGHWRAKLCAALDITQGGRLIWTDDDAIPTEGLAREALDAAGALLIAPDERRGLRPEHLDEIEAYIGCPAKTTP